MRQGGILIIIGRVLTARLNGVMVPDGQNTPCPEQCLWEGGRAGRGLSAGEVEPFLWYVLGFSLLIHWIGLKRRNVSRLTQSNGSLALSRLQSVCFRPGAQKPQDTNWVFWLAEIHSTQLNGGIMTAVSCLESVIRRGSFYNLCLNQWLSVQRYSVKRCGTFKIYFGLPDRDSLILSNLTLKKHIWLLGTELI